MVLLISRLVMWQTEGKPAPDFPAVADVTLAGASVESYYIGSWTWNSVLLAKSRRAAWRETSLAKLGTPVAHKLLEISRIYTAQGRSQLIGRKGSRHRFAD
jgi:hypothetical protein